MNLLFLPSSECVYCDTAGRIGIGSAEWRSKQIEFELSWSKIVCIPALIADLSQESNCEIPFQLEICEETLARCIAAIGIAVPVPYPMDSLPHIAAEAHHHRVGSDANGHSVYRCPNVRRSLAVIAMARDARNARFRCVFHKYGLGRFHTVSAT